jgi:hypothetical protein
MPRNTPAKMRRKGRRLQREQDETRSIMEKPARKARRPSADYLDRVVESRQRDAERLADRISPRLSVATSDDNYWYPRQSLDLGENQTEVVPAARSDLPSHTPNTRSSIERKRSNNAKRNGRRRGGKRLPAAK